MATGRMAKKEPPAASARPQGEGGVDVGQSDQEDLGRRSRDAGRRRARCGLGLPAGATQALGVEAVGEGGLGFLRDRLLGFRWISRVCSCRREALALPRLNLR